MCGIHIYSVIDLRFCMKQGKQATDECVLSRLRTIYNNASSQPAYACHMEATHTLYQIYRKLSPMLSAITVRLRYPVENTKVWGLTPFSQNWERAPFSSPWQRSGLRRLSWRLTVVVVTVSCCLSTAVDTLPPSTSNSAVALTPEHWQKFGLSSVNRDPIYFQYLYVVDTSKISLNNVPIPVFQYCGMLELIFRWWKPRRVRYRILLHHYRYSTDVPTWYVDYVRSVRNRATYCRYLRIGVTISTKTAAVDNESMREHWNCSLREVEYADLLTAAMNPSLAHTVQYSAALL
jgi:hypothetical protein